MGLDWGTRVSGGDAHITVPQVSEGAMVLVMCPLPAIPFSYQVPVARLWMPAVLLPLRLSVSPSLCLALWAALVLALPFSPWKTGCR